MDLLRGDDDLDSMDGDTSRRVFVFPYRRPNGIWRLRFYQVNHALATASFRDHNGCFQVFVSLPKVCREDLDAFRIYNLWRCFCGEFSLSLVRKARVIFSSFLYRCLVTLNIIFSSLHKPSTVSVNWVEFIIGSNKLVVRVQTPV
jgi:hypothetical protein